MSDAFEKRFGSMTALSLAGLALVSTPVVRCGNGGSGVSPETSADEPPSLTIVLTSDIGGELGTLAQRATIVDQARSQSGALVQVDAGDLFPALGPDALARR